VASCDGTEPAEEAVGRADAALYQAKRDGGNRVASMPGPAS
jgi:PleD family two-component response regulator